MIANEPHVIADSLWNATANEAAKCPKLTDNITAEVVIVGGGFTGLSAALHLAELGIKAVVLEAETPGWGASGRNGGQVNPGLSVDPDQILKDFGEEMGTRMINLSGGAADLVFSLIEKYKIDCDPVRTGWVRPAHNRKSKELLKFRTEQWARYGSPMKILDRDELAHVLGSSMYEHGGSIDIRGGNIHPLNYALGLTKAALDAGVEIYGHSRAVSLTKQGGKYILKTEHGSVTAKKILLGTNGYTDGLTPPLAQTIVPVRSTQVATKPLSNNIAKSILPECQAPSDTQRLLLYFRKDAAGRFIMGGRGSYDDAETARNQESLRQISMKMFPQLEDVEWEYAWGGFIAMTMDRYPHLNKLDDGIIAGLGYNGRGVAMATAMGKVMADWAAGTAEKGLDFPVIKPKPIAFHRFHKLGAAFEVKRMQMLDWLRV